MKKFILFITSIALLYFSTIAAQAQTTGSFSKTITFKSQARSIYYHVPTTYNSSNQYKLIIGLHGCGGNGSNFRDQLQFLSDSLNAIVVCPEGLAANSGFMGNEINILLTTIDSTKKNYNIDLKHVYLTGFSCNGFSTLTTATLNLFPFKGIIPFNPALDASYFTSGYFNYAKNIPTCICAGTADGGYNNDVRFRDSLAAHNAPFLFNSMSGIGHTTVFPTFKEEMMECFTYFSTLTSVFENKNLSSLNINVYPNPTSGKVTVSSTEKITAIEIYNMLGEKVYAITNYNQQIVNEIDLSNSSKGIYFIKVYAEKNSYTEKMVVQ